MTTPMRAEMRHRVEGPDKVTGRARYAAEYPAPPGVDTAHGCPVTATVAQGRITRVDVAAVCRLPGVIGVLWHGNAPRLAPSAGRMTRQLQSDRVRFHGEVVALVVATTSEAARAAAESLPVEYETDPHDTRLHVGAPDAVVADAVTIGLPGVSVRGHPRSAFAGSAVRVEAVYRTPAQHAHPMEPHATTAWWQQGRLVLFDSNQGGHRVAAQIAEIFALAPGDVRVVTEHLGGGFGSKSSARPQVVLAAMAAREFGTAVCVVLGRAEMTSLVGHRAESVQRIRLGAHPDGRLVSLDHDVLMHTAHHEVFCEQTAVVTRSLYAAEHRSTVHRTARRHIPITASVRAPGEAPGMFALESAMDELAVATGVDPVELRIRNEPARDPEHDIPFSSRNLVACLRRRAELFGWADRDPVPRSRRDGR